MGSRTKCATFNIFEDKAIQKIYAYKFFVPDDLVADLENVCIENNISVTTFEGLSVGGIRYMMNMHLNKKQVEIVMNFFETKNLTPTAGSQPQFQNQRRRKQSL